MQEKSFLKKDILKIAEVLKHQKKNMPGCNSYKDAWENYMHPLIKKQATLEEVMNHIGK
ncbi:hypothetical protein [Priestia aryabhattai]